MATYLNPADRTQLPVPRSRAFVVRSVSLILLLLAEWIPISVLMHTGKGGQSAGRGLVAFGSLFLAFGYLRNKRIIRAIAGEVQDFRVSPSYLTLHLLLMAAFLGLSTISGSSAALVAVWYAAGIGAIVLAGITFLPSRIWWSLLRNTGPAGVYALAGGVMAWASVRTSWSLWNNSSVKLVAGVTFRLVELVLRPFLPDMIVDRPELTIGSAQFNVSIGDACSGLEGVALIVVFSVIYLILFRSECRFPRALLIIPAGVGIVFLLNPVRIAALILIGAAGAPAIAMGGFHSQAGWIGFNVVALSCMLVVPRISWLRARTAVSRERTEANPAVPWLLPFAFLIAAGMISRAGSAQFEWLYPVRVLAVALALWGCRNKHVYKTLILWPGWESLLAGLVAFFIWLALDRGPHDDSGIAAGLAAMPETARMGWILCRTLGAVITVPIAEELAFRGFLLRRLVSRDFELVDFRRFNWLALVVSSLAFGVMHGNRWIAGTLAGAIYAAVMIRRGRISAAIFSHATTNAAVAAWVLIGGNWHLW